MKSKMNFKTMKKSSKTRAMSTCYQELKHQNLMESRNVQVMCLQAGHQKSQKQ